MISGSIPVRSSTALIAVAASSSTGTVRRLPPNVPTGVRTGATIAARRMVMFGPPFGSAPAPVVRVGDRDHPLTPTGQAQPAQVGHSILGHYHACVGPGQAGRAVQPGHDAAGRPGGRGEGNHRDAARRPGRAAQEIRGAADAADVAAGRDLDVGLPGQVDLHGRVDRDQGVLGGEYRLVVGVAGVA